MAAEARAVAADNARAGPVFISGAAGMNSAGINGFYSVTEEKSSDGRVVLSKRGDANMCIEHFAGKWQVKDVSSKGKDVAFASFQGGCALEDCTSRVWMVYNGKEGEDQPSVKIVTGKEAERQVRGSCRRARKLNPVLLNIAFFADETDPKRSLCCVVSRPRSVCVLWTRSVCRASHWHFATVYAFSLPSTP